MNNEGFKHIHNLMHVFIEGIAAGLYDSLDDIQCDACEYLAMERAVEKLSNWNENSNVNDLAIIFDGVSNSIMSRKEREELQRMEQACQLDDMPKLEEVGDLINVEQQRS